MSALCSLRVARVREQLGGVLLFLELLDQDLETLAAEVLQLGDLLLCFLELLLHKGGELLVVDDILLDVVGGLALAVAGLEVAELLELVELLAEEGVLVGGELEHVLQLALVEVLPDLGEVLVDHPGEQVAHALGLHDVLHVVEQLVADDVLGAHAHLALEVVDGLQHLVALHVQEGGVLRGDLLAHRQVEVYLLHQHVLRDHPAQLVRLQLDLVPEETQVLEVLAEPRENDYVLLGGLRDEGEDVDYRQH